MRRDRYAAPVCRRAMELGPVKPEAYDRRIHPLLRELSNSALALALGVSIAYAADIRAGRRSPHPRHWQALAQLVGVSSEE